MIEDIKELKKFINWCRKNGVKRLSLGSISFEIEPEQPEIQEMSLEEVFRKVDSGLQFDDSFAESAPLSDEDRVSANLRSKKMSKEDEELLFWSVDR